MGMVSLHRSHGQNYSHEELLSLFHLQFPDKEEGQDRKDPIPCTGDGGVGIRRINGDLRIDARSFGAGELGPEV